MSVRGFRDSLRSYVPAWLQNRPPDPVTGKPRNVGYRILYAMVFPLDVAVQAIVESLKAAFPGLGTASANPAIAQSRGLIQGEAESQASFAKRTINWLSSWDENGSYASEQLARQIQAYFANTPVVRVIDRVGHWMTLDSGGVATQVTASWDWDSVSNPERQGLWSDLWIVVYPCEWTQAPTFEARKASPRGTGDGIGVVGGQALRTASDAILSLCALRKGAHTRIVAIIYSFDPTLCVPGGSNNPDGTWGEWAKPSAGPSSPLIPARSANARYAIPAHLF